MMKSTILLLISMSLFGGCSLVSRLDRAATATPTAGAPAEPGTPSANELNEPGSGFGSTAEQSYGDPLKGKKLHIDQVLVFQNDNLRLGPVNKARVKELVTLFDAETDAIALVGCSNSKFALDDDQSYQMALSRAERVREELITQGIPESLILGEGCWGTVQRDDFPATGVVITLYRATS